MAEHVCESRYTNGDDMTPEEATCGACGLSWCNRCDPAPSAMCHYCHGLGYSTAPLGAVAFFAEHMGVSYNPATETPEQGTLRNAVSLALAEKWANASGAAFMWEDDFTIGSHREFYGPESAYANPDHEPETCETLTMYLPDPSPSLESVQIVDMLGCIDDATDDYRRVCEAEMADNVRSRMTWRVECSDVDEVTNYETWVEAREALVTNIESRIRSLISDMASGHTTGSEAQSVQALTDALIDIACHSKHETITATADGIDFRAERIER
jgi:hypothetical protein